MNPLLSTVLRCCVVVSLSSVLLGIFSPRSATASTPFYLHEIVPYVDEHGSGGLFDLRARVPAGAIVTLQFKYDLNARAWQDFGAPVIAGQSGWITFTVPDFSLLGGQQFPARQAFFRLAVQEFPANISDDGQLIKLETTVASPAGVLLDKLGQTTGRNYYLVGADPFATIVPPGSFEAPNDEDLLNSLGLRVWATPPKEDDEAFAQRLPLQSGNQRNPLDDPPGDVGVGKITDGWQGIPNFPRPFDGPIDPPQPSPNADKILRAEIPDVPPGEEQKPNPNLPEPGIHYRLQILLKLGGELRPEAASLSEGDSFLAADPCHVGLGEVLYAVISEEGAPNAPGNIYYIGALGDVFGERSYEPPHRGAHGGQTREEAQIRLPIPIPGAKQGGISVHFFRYVRPGKADCFGPRELLNELNNFEPLGIVTEEQIIELTRQQQLAAAMASPPPGATRAATLTQLHSSGSRASKFNMVIIGDGFRDTATDQNLFNSYVSNVVMTDLITRDIHPEILNALNIYRINTFSIDSGVTQVNSNGVVTTARSTALDFRYSGRWNRCWMEGGPNTATRQANIINSLIPEANVIAILLNETGQGGCAWGGSFAVTRGAGWSVFAHEFGHFFGRLQDEYQCNMGSTGCQGSYGGAELPEVNQTMVTTRASIKWNEWIPATRPVPTAQANVAVTDQDVGLFPGATRGNQQWWNGIFRPSFLGRMNNNAPEHNPVGYTKMRDEARPRQDGDFRKSVAGDFNGDGKTDLAILDSRQLSLYLAGDRNVGVNDPITGNPPRGVTGVLAPTWYRTDILYNAAKTVSWEFRPTDILVPGDFDGDGRTDLYVINLVSWNFAYLCMLRSTGTGFEPVRRYDRDLPGWDAMLSGDEFYACDYTGDGKDDLLVFNGVNWIMPYFLMLRSDGTRLIFSRRYDHYLPVWEMGRHEKFHVGDFNGDGRQDVIAHNRDNWNQVHLQVQVSTGSGLTLASRYYGTVSFPGGGLFWTMRRQDEITLPNFNGDGRTDVAIFNGRDWSEEYLGVFAMSDTASLLPRRRYDNVIPGWDMRRRDRFHAADVNGDGLQDLVVYNGVNWSYAYLGMLRTDREGNLSGSWQEDWIGGWHMGPGDALHVAEFRGAAGWTDLFIYNKDWFGLLRSYSNRYMLDAIYPKWIHNHRFHAWGLW